MKCKMLSFPLCRLCACRQSYKSTNATRGPYSRFSRSRKFLGRLKIALSVPNQHKHVQRSPQKRLGFDSVDCKLFVCNLFSGIFLSKLILYIIPSSTSREEKTVDIRTSFNLAHAEAHCMHMQG